MSKNRNREEAINTQLAILISRFGVTADAETIQVHGQHRPDVLFQLRGLRVIIEGKFADNPNAEQTVLEDARNRVRNGVAHIAAAAVYPLELRTTPTTRILEVLERSPLKWGRPNSRVIVRQIGQSRSSRVSISSSKRP